jgi:hypothetical protein
MPNQFLNTSWVSMQILRLLLNKLVVVEYFNRSWEKDFEKEFAPGSSVSVKFPQRFTTSDGMGYQPQGLNRISTTVNLDQWVQVAFEWDDYERAVKLERSKEELQEQYWEPAAAAMAQEFDSRAAKWAYQNASMTANVASPGTVNQLGTDPTAVNIYYQARRRLLEMSVPPGKRAMIVSSAMMGSLGANITTIFNPADEITRSWKEGSIGKLGGFDFFESNSLWSHTAGTWASTVSVTGAGQTGSSLIITGTAADTIKKGDKFSIANVNQVNPMTRRVAGLAAAKTFTVLADYTLTSGPDTIQIAPAIYGPGSQYQNVDALAADAAAMTLWPGTSSPNGKVGTVGFGLTKYAFMLAATKLYVPKAVEQAGQAQDPDSGISIRKVIAWDPRSSMQINRLDSLLGFGNGYIDSGAVVVVGA